MDALEIVGVIVVVLAGLAIIVNFKDIVRYVHLARM